MILTAIGPVTAYRMHVPKWATAPTSGAGALPKNQASWR